MVDYNRTGVTVGLRVGPAGAAVVLVRNGHFLPTHLGVHTPELEEQEVMKKLRDREDPDTVIPAKPARSFDLLALLSGGTGTGEVPTYQVPSLFPSDRAFVDEALQFAFNDADQQLDIRREHNDPEFLSLVPPADLASRFRALPQSYLSEQKITDRIRLTGDAHHAEAALSDARASTESQWPRVGFLSPLHPTVDWLVDKVLAKIGRNEAPVLVANVDRPTFAVLGSFSNGRGQPQLVEWMAVSVGPDGTIVSDLFATLARAGVSRAMANPGALVSMVDITQHVSIAVEAARRELDRRNEAHDGVLAALLDAPRQRLDGWRQGSHQLSLLLDDKRRRERDRYTRSVVDDTAALIESMRTVGRPLVRVLAVLVGRSK